MVTVWHWAQYQQGKKASLQNQPAIHSQQLTFVETAMWFTWNNTKHLRQFWRHIEIYTNYIIYMQTKIPNIIVFFFSTKKCGINNKDTTISAIEYQCNYRQCVKVIFHILFTRFKLQFLKGTERVQRAEQNIQILHSKFRWIIFNLHFFFFPLITVANSSINYWGYI